MKKNLPRHSKFVQLLTDHQEILRCYIGSLMPGCPDERDILQEVNLVLWEKMDKFEMDTSFKAWAFSIVRFKVLNYKKKQRNHGWLIFNNEVIDVLDHTDHERDPEHMTSQRIELRKCLSHLKPKDLALLKARYILEQPLMQYSKEVDRSEAGLRVTLHRLRAILRNCITTNLNGEGATS